MPRRFVFWTLAALAVLAATWQAWMLRWTCDDAFISFRYAQHFVEGHGLVFNLDPSEAPVEGYTNFSWTLLLALGLQLGFVDRGLETWSILWGIAAHAGTVLLLATIAWRASGGRALVPIAACGYAAIHHASSLAPAGLETASFVLLVTAMLRSCLLLPGARQAWGLGLLGVLAAMTRPDGAVPVAMTGLFVLAIARQRRALGLMVGYVVPFLVVFAPYLLWRHSYYGHWLPNTFYAKSGSDPYVAQGFVYARDFFVCYWPLLLPFVPLAWFAAKRPDALAAGDPCLGRWPWLVIAAFVGSYLAFVLWVGGDFMFGRFLLPILPALLLALDFACLRWRAKWLPPVLAAVVVAGCVFRVEPEGLGDHRRDVSDNRVISFLEPVPGITLSAAFREAGNYLRPLFDGLDVRLAIAGGQANFAYRSRVPTAIECAAGLTDAYIARLPAVGNKRGHDKPRDPAYLERRGVHFMLETSYGGGLGKVDTWRDIRFPAPPLGIFEARLVTWDRELMRELRRREPNLGVQDFEQFLDTYIADLPNKTKDQVRADYLKFTPFYFARNDDPGRKAAFESFLR